MVTYMT